MVAAANAIMIPMIAEKHNKAVLLPMYLIMKVQETLQIGIYLIYWKYNLQIQAMKTT